IGAGALSASPSVVAIYGSVGICSASIIRDRCLITAGHFYDAIPGPAVVKQVVKPAGNGFTTPRLPTDNPRRFWKLEFDAPQDPEKPSTDYAFVWTTIHAPPKGISNWARLAVGPPAKGAATIIGFGEDCSLPDSGPPTYGTQRTGTMNIT